MYRVKPKSYAGYTKKTVQDFEKSVQNLKVFRILERIKNGLLVSIYVGLLFVALILHTV